MNYQNFIMHLEFYFGAAFGILEILSDKNSYSSSEQTGLKAIRNCKFPTKVELGSSWVDSYHMGYSTLRAGPAFCLIKYAWETYTISK